MFHVILENSQDRRYRPMTVNATEYLFGLARLIARSVPDSEVHAHLGSQIGDELIFRGAGLPQAEIELF